MKTRHLHSGSSRPTKRSAPPITNEIFVMSMAGMNEAKQHGCDDSSRQIDLETGGIGTNMPGRGPDNNREVRAKRRGWVR